MSLFSYVIIVKFEYVLANVGLEQKIFATAYIPQFKDIWSYFVNFCRDALKFESLHLFPEVMDFLQIYTLVEMQEKFAERTSGSKVC